MTSSRKVLVYKESIALACLTILFTVLETVESNLNKIMSKLQFCWNVPNPTLKRQQTSVLNQDMKLFYSP